MQSMRRLAILAAIILTISFLVTNTRVIAQQPTPTVLNKTLYYWDLGLSLKVPTNWTDPQYSVGQMIAFAAAPNSADNGTVKHPTIAARVFRSATVVQMPKDATLIAIAQALGAGKNVTVTESGAVTVAGLDAGYVGVDFQPDPNSSAGELLSKTFVYRGLDGRLGALLFISPVADWPDFTTLSSQIANTAALLKPSDFPVPTFGTQDSLQLFVFAAGHIKFTLPDKWFAKAVTTTSLIYHDHSAPEYADQSGYANGPLLVINAVAMPAKTTLHDAVAKIVQPTSDATISDVTVGGQPGVQIAFTDPRTGQIETIVGFTSQDQRVLNLFRWTVPGMLVDVLRPTFDAILTSVQYDTVLPLAPRLAPTAASTVAAG